MKVTEEDMQANVAKIGHLPEDVIQLYVDRKTRWKECIAACEEILAQEPEHCAALIYLGNIYMERKQPIKALRYFTRVTEIAPLLHPGWQGKGMCEIHLRRLRAAQFSFGRFMETAPRQPFPVCCIALVFYLKGSKDLAIKFLDDIVATGNVDNPEVLIHIRAILEEKMGLADEALLHYIESQMMSKEKDADTAFKIHTLSSARGEREES
jgi:tetratricopeptide (TPR) repeat protein